MVASDVVFESRPLTKPSDGDEVSEVLQTMSLNEDDRGRGLVDAVPAASTTAVKRWKTREVASRYNAATVSSANAAAITALRYQSPIRGRSPSPNFGRRSLDGRKSLDVVLKTPPQDKRPSSAERRQPWPAAACENKTPTSHNIVNASRNSASVKRLAVRSLSSSMQSDTSVSSSSNDGTTELLQSLKGSLSTNGHKACSPSAHENRKTWNSSTKSSEGKVTPVRKRSPLRRSLQASEQIENAKPLSNVQAAKVDMRRWNGVGNGKPVLSKSMDFTLGKGGTLSRSTSLLARSPLSNKAATNSRLLSRSANEGPNPKVVRRIYPDSGDEKLLKSNRVDERNGNRGAIQGSILRENSLDDNGSDTESCSSGSFSVASFGGVARPKATAVPAHFWQDSTSLASMRRLKVPGSSRSSTPVRASESGHSTPQHPSSPSSQAKPMHSLSSSSGSWASPVKTRTGHPMLMSQLSLNGRRSNIPGLLNLNFETRKLKLAMGQQEEAHDLRLLQNRWLQWRFVNAQTELAMNMQAATAECMLYNCFLRTCDLRTSVAAKQKKQNKLKQAIKLDSILADNAVQLEEWETLQRGHVSTLTGVMNALEATVIRVPLTGGIKIDIQATKEILSSANDIMNGVDASIDKFLQKAELADSLLSELAKTIVLEKSCLSECGDLLAAAATLEVEERSLRAYFVQQQQEQEKRSAVVKLETPCVVEGVGS